MSSGFFGVLQTDDDSSDEDSAGGDRKKRQPNKNERQDQQHRAAAAAQEGASASSPPIPAYEDLSTTRMDEITVLEAVYGEDFTRTEGVWGCPHLQVRVTPPDIDPVRVGSHLVLSAQLSKQYPYVAPALELRDIKGLTRDEQAELNKQLTERAKELSKSGSVMMIELVQVAEDYLFSHNRDPTLSEWEQMKAREALKLEEERKVKDEMTRLMNSAGHTPSPNNALVPLSPRTSTTRVTFRDDGGAAVGRGGDGVASSAIEREMMRQQEAFQAVQRNRGAVIGSPAVVRRESTVSGNGDETDDLDTMGDEVGGDDDDGGYEGLALTGLSSRYKSDFIELGLLGRGGGGEVVKVRNRLDRRIYAIKKIILESEEGRFAEYGAIQNRKLRREVTTISRMTHKNIVRYYQAWVEGGSSDGKAKTIDAIQEESNVASAELGDGASSSDEDSDEGGWWASASPRDRHRSSAREGISFAENADGDDDDDDDDDGSSSEEQTGSSSNFFEEGSHQGFHSPLMNGLGFQNQTYGGIFANNDRPSSRDLPDSGGTTSSDIPWDDSSVKVGSVNENGILYIQMEYCSTTLRKLIDDQECTKMEENDVWRLVRQTLEGLVYIHGRNIIHRGESASFLLRPRHDERYYLNSAFMIIFAERLETEQHLYRLRRQRALGRFWPCYTEQGQTWSRRHRGRWR